MIEKEKALKVAMSLIEFQDSTLDTKYSHSHEKVAVIYKEHTIELIGGDEKFITYLDVKIPLTGNEYKQVYKCFSEELKKRKANSTIEKFNTLEQTLKDFGKKG
jgi:hypothetical protein